MYCCLAEICCSENDSPETKIEQLKEMIMQDFDFIDQLTAIRRRILLLTPMEAYADVRKKLTCIQERFKKEHKLKLTWGFAEVKDGDILEGINGAKQMLALTTDINPISGMRYYRFTRFAKLW